MLKTCISILVLSVVLLAAGCGDDDGGTTTPPVTRTDAEVLDAGWAGFEAADYDAAKTEFRTLLARGALPAEAHDGLGWTFGYQSQADLSFGHKSLADSSLVHHERSLELGGAALDIADQMYAGLALSRHATGDRDGSLEAVDMVDTAWVFVHDPAIDHGSLLEVQDLIYVWILADGWTAFEAADFAAAEAEFNRILGFNVHEAEAHDGLGWTFARQSDAGSAASHYESALAAGSGGLDIADEVQAGLAFARSATLEFEASLEAASLVSNAWVFAHDDQIDRDDVTLLEASAHYALGDFAASLAAVQILDPSFDADVDTVAGRAALAAKIESLQG